ncbi:MAG: sugar phosphate isomerase/epimerase [Clostridia bacterium]|nr:sugar phosphate isomerase/epimerase [Clostridia bacterium]
MKAGLNLFSIRNLLGTEEAFLDTAWKLKEMGYSYLQFSGMEFDADLIKRVSEATGLPIVLTHVPMDRILNDTDALMEEHARFGCHNIGLGAMPGHAIADESLCKETVEKLNAAGEKMAKNGFKFFYHHHHFEFFRHQGETVFDYIIKNAPYINFTADTYWLQFGGVNVAETLRKLSGRIECVHLKDYGIVSKIVDEKTKFEPTFVPVGSGTLDFKAAVAAAKEAGAKYFLVEQDNASKHPDTLGQVKMSIDYITNEL